MSTRSGWHWRICSQTIPDIPLYIPILHTIQAYIHLRSLNRHKIGNLSVFAGEKKQSLHRLDEISIITHYIQANPCSQVGAFCSICQHCCYRKVQPFFSWADKKDAHFFWRFARAATNSMLKNRSLLTLCSIYTLHRAVRVARYREWAKQWWMYWYDTKDLQIKSHHYNQFLFIKDCPKVATLT